MFHVEHFKNLSHFEQKQIELYIQELLSFNKTYNFFSIKEAKLLCLSLILDSVLGSKALLADKKHSFIADIGSGAGFPGLILAILDPLLSVVLYEPNQQKSEFLNYICWKMKLSNVKVKTLRIQEEKQNIKCAVSKAFLSLNKRLQISQNLFKKGDIYYHFQTLGWKKTWDKENHFIKSCWRIQEIKQYECQPFFSRRVLLKTIKI